MSPFSVDLEPIEVGDFIEVDGWPSAVLSKATVRWRRSAPSIVVTFTPLRNRSVAIESLTLEGSRDRPLTSADLRSFQYRQLTSALVTFLAVWGPGSPWATTVAVRQISREDIRGQQQTYPPLLGGLGLSDDFLEVLSDPGALAEMRDKGPRTLFAVEVVNYLLDYAAANGLAPHTLVREVLGLPKATASRWIAVARELRAGGHG